MNFIIKLLCGSSLCLLFGCMQQDQQQIQQMEANKKIARDSWEAFNQKDAAKATSYYAENAVVQDYGEPKPRTGKEEIQQVWQMYITAFPDAHVTIEGELAHGDTVVQQWRVNGTNTGPLMEMPATNKSVEVHGCSIFHMVNGKIEHEWEYWDQLSFMKQLGMMPEPGSQPEAEKKGTMKK